MPYFVSVSNFRPPPRYDGLKWLTATLQESVDPGGPWTDVEAFAVTDYATPSAPPEVAFSSSLATIAPDVGWFRLVFTDAATGISEAPAIGPSGYPTTEELVAESSVDELVSATEDDQDLWRDEAVTAVEWFCGQTFEKLVGTLAVDGRSGDVIYLPRRLEVLDGIAVNGQAWTLDMVAVGPDGDRITRLASWAPNYAVQAIRSISGYVDSGFDTGRGSIAITGTWGWSVVPVAVRRAIRLDMEDAALAEATGLAATVRAYRKMGVKNISQGNLRADVGEAPTLSPRVERLLTPFAWNGIGRKV